MNEIASKLAGTAPELLVMILFVWMFLKAQERRDKLFIAALEQVTSQHVEAREQSRQVIQANTLHTQQSAIAFATLTEVMRSCASRKGVDSPLSGA